MKVTSQQIIRVFEKHKTEQRKIANGDFPVRLPTWCIRRRIEETFGGKVSCVDIRKVISGMTCVQYDEHSSRAGNYVWRYLP